MSTFYFKTVDVVGGYGERFSETPCIHCVSFAKGADMLVLPLLVMGSLLVIGGMFSLLLPETLHQHLPQTLEDGETFGKDWFTCCPTRYLSNRY